MYEPEYLIKEQYYGTTGIAQTSVFQMLHLSE